MTSLKYSFGEELRLTCLIFFHLITYRGTPPIKFMATISNHSYVCSVIPFYLSVPCLSLYLNFVYMILHSCHWVILQECNLHCKMFANAAVT